MIRDGRRAPNPSFHTTGNPRAPYRSILPVLAALLLMPAIAHSQTIRDDLYITNGYVSDVAQVGNTLYLGGGFTQVTPPLGGGVPIDMTTGLPIAGFPKVAGIVHAVAPDGSGGWFIGGSFLAVGGVGKRNLAHIRSDFSIASWAPSADATVKVITVSGGIVYVAGDFEHVGAHGGVARFHAAALDTGVGLATSWDPGLGFNQYIHAIAVNSNMVYVGGTFTNVGGQPRNNIAAISATTSLATTWNPNCNGSVSSLLVDAGSSRILVGGQFTTIGGQSRSNCAALNLGGIGLATGWIANADWPVNAMTFLSGRLFAAGSFTAIGGHLRSGLAELNPTVGNATSWNPVLAGSLSFTVDGVAGSGNTIFVAGNFATAGGQTRNHLAAFDATTALVTAWNPNAGNPALAVVASGTTVYAGGTFSGLGGISRRNLAALDLTTGQPTAWDPNPNNAAVSTLAALGATLYVGGSFTTIAGQSRAALAAFDTGTGLITPWNPNVDQSPGDPAVYESQLVGNTLYISGGFNTVGGAPRGDIAAVDATTGAVTSWNPNPNSPPRAFVVGPNAAYLAGSFSTVGGQPANDLVAVNLTTGAQLPFNFSNDVYSMALSGNTLYIGGRFVTVQGQPRQHIASLNATTGNVTSWNPSANFDGYVYELLAASTRVYAGGDFTSIGGNDRSRLAAIHPTTGGVTDWDPGTDGGISSFNLIGTTLYVAGFFNRAGYHPQAHIAAISTAEPLEFLDATTGPLGDTGPGNGVAWGDFDGDGDLDLFLTNNIGGSNKLFRNDGGTWADATISPLGSTNGSFGAAWGDYDNDEDVDLFVNSGVSNKLFRNDGGTWTDVATGALATPRNGRNVVWADFDRDGDLDLYLANDAQANKLFRNDGGGIFADATVGPLGDGGNSQGAAAGDYDNDGDLDLYVVKSGQANKLFRNNGTTWVDATSGPLGDTGSGRGAAWGDYDNDGDLDLYLSNFGTANRLFRNDGGTWVNATTGPLGDTGAGTGVAWIDIDNDGDLDLYLGNSGTANKLFRNDGGSWADATTGPLANASNTRATAWGDYDRDGDLDLYIVNNNAANVLVQTDGIGGGWLDLDLHGTASNRNAIGTRVRIVAGGVSRIQEVTAGSGYLTQNALAPHFGVGDAAIIDSLVVRWPSGVTWDTTGVEVNQVLPVFERMPAAGVEPGMLARALELAPSVPNPFRRTVRFDYTLPAPARTRLLVIDLQGRHVATLSEGRLAAGRHTGAWDGRNALGREMEAGVYFVRLATGEGDHERAVTRKIVMIR